MIRKRFFAAVMAIALAATLFGVAGLYAGTKVADEFEMNSPYKHKKTIPVFTHKKHITDFKIGCGECHHDDKGKPLNNLKMGDNVKKCFECHNKPGELKGKKAKGLSEKQKLEYEANAVHANCIGCHRNYNNEKKTQAAPTKCADCHPKAAKK